jgi:hypothetical protein
MSVCAVFSVRLSTQMWVCFPAHVLIVPCDVFASDSERALVPKHRLNPSTIHLLNDGDATTEDRHAVATLDSTFLLALRIPALTPLNEQVECWCLITRILYPQRHISFSAYQSMSQPNVSNVLRRGSSMLMLTGNISNGKKKFLGQAYWARHPSSCSTTMPQR